MTALGTVYVVDDDASVRRGMARLLRSYGYDVVTFASGEAFLEGPYGRTGACLVLDVRMPGLTGFDVQAALAAMGRDVPVVFITGHGDPTMGDRARDAGAVAFLQKPVDESVLLAAIEMAIGSPSVGNA